MGRMPYRCGPNIGSGLSDYTYNLTTNWPSSSLRPAYCQLRQRKGWQAQLFKRCGWPLQTAPIVAFAVAIITIEAGPIREMANHSYTMRC